MNSQLIEKLPIGTRIRFPQHIGANANEEHPALTYAMKGELGKITGYSQFMGYTVTTDSWPKAFTAADSEFEVVQELPS